MTDDLALTFRYQVDDIVTGVERPSSLDDVDFFGSVACSVREGAGTWRMIVVTGVDQATD